MNMNPGKIQFFSNVLNENDPRAQINNAPKKNEISLYSPSVFFYYLKFLKFSLLFSFLLRCFMNLALGLNDVLVEGEATHL